jgi:hypothetical protein
MTPRANVTNETFTIEGFLLAGPDGWLRLLVATTCLDVHEEDLVALEELPPPDDLRADVAVHVSVELRRPCRIREIIDGESLDAQLWVRPSPFAYVSRAGDAAHQPPQAFRARERTYIDELDAYDRSRP